MGRETGAETFEMAVFNVTVVVFGVELGTVMELVVDVVGGGVFLAFTTA